jgi:DNA repair protein RecN (Recombination protein N)
VLRQLHITGLGVIGELDIEPAPGLTVLTGETGAGKTMITVGVSLALGGRGNAQLVRSGERAAKIQARFDAPAGAEGGALSLHQGNIGDAEDCERVAAIRQLPRSRTLIRAVESTVASVLRLDGATRAAFLDRRRACQRDSSNVSAACASLQAARRGSNALDGARS